MTTRLYSECLSCDRLDCFFPEVCPIWAGSFEQQERKEVVEVNTGDQTVSLIDHMGTDLTVVNAARVSMNKHHNEWEDGDLGLVKYLSSHNHFTPFAHPQIQLRETVPIFVARQRFKHTVGFSYNEISRRYVDEAPEFFSPDVWRNRPQGNIKQGSEGINPNQAHWNAAYALFLQAAETMYMDMIGDGIAPEQARMVLPQSMMTSYYVTGSLAAFARAYKLRAAHDAQGEIQVVAGAWDRIIRPLYPNVWGVLVDA